MLHFEKKKKASFMLHFKKGCCYKCSLININDNFLLQTMNYEKF